MRRKRSLFHLIGRHLHYQFSVSLPNCFSLTLKSILQKKKTEEPEKQQSWFKRNKNRKPIKYDIESLFGKDNLKKDAFKWYYPLREKEVTSATTVTSPSSSIRSTTEETTTPPDLSSLPGNFQQLISSSELIIPADNTQSYISYFLNSIIV